jgi:hypothetical protein
MAAIGAEISGNPQQVMIASPVKAPLRRDPSRLIFAEQLDCGTALVGAFFNRG